MTMMEWQITSVIGGFPLWCGRRKVLWHNEDNGRRRPTLSTQDTRFVLASNRERHGAGRRLFGHQQTRVLAGHTRPSGRHSHVLDHDVAALNAQLLDEDAHFARSPDAGA